MIVARLLVELNVAELVGQLVILLTTLAAIVHSHTTRKICRRHHESNVRSPPE